FVVNAAARYSRAGVGQTALCTRRAAACRGPTGARRPGRGPPGAALLLFAVDGAESGRRKLGATAGDLPSASVLTAAELGGAFGHERIVHAAVGGGTLCDRLRLDLARLAGFRADAVID